MTSKNIHGQTAEVSARIVAQLAAEEECGAEWPTTEITRKGRQMTRPTFAAGDRVRSTDPEDNGARGTVVKTTGSGGVCVLWDADDDFQAPHQNWPSASQLEKI